MSYIYYTLKAESRLIATVDKLEDKVKNNNTEFRCERRAYMSKTL